MNVRRLVAPLVLMGAALSAGMVVSSPAWAGGDTSAGEVETQACGLYAGSIKQTGRVLSGSGGRSGCFTHADVNVGVYEEIAWWPDRRLSSASRHGIRNVHLTVSAGCTSIPGPYYIETRSSTGGVSEGSHKSLCH
ncbi:hypothetical protein SAMN05216266_13333 [Amycolatopsis marina]|uniref:Secreted protein n=1 Tax=Amycolatopsis marina TaxID=490629 RepID=A0A1I1CKC8_9PSEU|nr:hypothetical protein SAMN05216266_13333 [Amycolatopsis marina]